jgi:hypothetical protein
MATAIHYPRHPSGLPRCRHLVVAILSALAHQTGSGREGSSDAVIPAQVTHRLRADTGRVQGDQGRAPVRAARLCKTLSHSGCQGKAKCLVA